MQVIIQPDRDSASELASEIIAERIRNFPNSVLGLATGRTMERLYARLVEKHRSSILDFSLLATFNLDEYIGLPPEDKNSYRYYMNKHLFDLVNINPHNTHLPSGTAPDLGKECRIYEEKIKALGGIDLQLLGLGESGHIGFNEPLSALKSRTRVKTLAPVTITQNSPLFSPPERMPKKAITMGVGTILEARQIVLLVTGESKADILRKAVEGPVTSMISASALQLHENCVVIVDEAAGKLLQEKECYHWIYANEPKWEGMRSYMKEWQAHRL